MKKVNLFFCLLLVLSGLFSNANASYWYGTAWQLPKQFFDAGENFESKDSAMTQACRISMDRWKADNPDQVEYGITEYISPVACTILYAGTASQSFGMIAYYCPPGSKPVGVQALCAPYDQYFVASVDFDPGLNSNEGPKKTNSCRPINTASGNKYRQEVDLTPSGASPIQFTRYYNSLTNAPSQLGSGWKHSYSSTIKSYAPDVDSQPTASYDSGSPGNSTLFNSKQEACESGWSQIKGQYSSTFTQNASARYENEKCNLYREDNILLGSIKIQVKSGEGSGGGGGGGAIPQEILLHKKIIRADGTRLKFIAVSDGVFVSQSDNNGKLEGYVGGFKYTDVSGNVEDYDVSGKLLSITARNGVKQTLNYDATTGYLSSVVDSFGKTLSFIYDATTSQLREITLPNQSTVTYTQSTNNNLTTVKREDDSIKTYHYEDVRFANALTGITDENNQRHMMFSYDAKGRATTSELGDGVTLSAEKVSVNFVDDNTSMVTDALGQARTYRFTAINGVKKLTDIEGATCGSCGGKATHTTYDANGYVNGITDFNGNTTTYINNSRGLATSRTEAVGIKDERTTSYEWHSSYALPTCIIEDVKTTRFSYTPDGSLETRTTIDTSDVALFATPESKVCVAIEARGDYGTLNKRSIGYTYYPNYGLVKTIDGPRTDINDITSFTYDAMGNLETITNALSHVTQLNNYTVRGKPQEIIDASGLVTTLTYDARGRVDVVTVGNLVTDYDFDSVGNLDLITRADGSFIDYEYDAAHRLTDIRDQTGSHIHYTLDALGNRKGTDIKDAGGNLKRTSTAIYNQLGQLEKTIGAALQTTDYLLYDNNGNLKHLRDADNKNTWLGYDALNRLETTTNELNDVSTTVYDAQDNITGVTDFKGLVTNYSFDGLGNRTELNSPDTGITQYPSHDGRGNVLTMIDAQNQTSTYTYDALNRIDFIIYNDGSTADYVYDVGVNAKGRLSSITYVDSTGTKTGNTAWTNDVYGRVNSKTETINAISLTTTYNFNPTTGQLENIITSGGHTISYAYLNAQVSGISIDGKSIMSGISYDPFAAANAWTWGNGTLSSRTYDLDGQLDTYTLGATTYDINYTPSGNVQTITDLTNAANNQSFNYDGLHRLKDYTGSTGSEVYDYDAGSNRIGLTDVTTALSDTYVIDPVSNKLTSITGMTNKTYNYNANGSVTSDGLHTYDYDARNRLTSVDTNLAVYQLNALGQRVQKDASGNITIFHYNEQGQLVAEADSTGFVSKEYIYFGNMPVAVLSAKQVNQTVDSIIDNTDAGVLLLGNWKSSTSVAGFEGLNYSYHAANSMPLSSIVVDNSSAGFSVTGTWKASTSVAGFEGANYQHHFANGVSPDAVAVDNVSGSAVGTWSNSTSVAGFEGSNYQYHAAGTGLNTFTWATGVTTAGVYNVYAKWTAHANRASNATYTITHTNGATDSIQSQQAQGGEWVLLGQFNLDNTSQVTLSDNANGYVIADGVMVAPIGAQPNTATWSIAPTIAGVHTVYAKWSSHANRASNASYTVHHADGVTTSIQNQQANGGQWIALGDFNLDANSKVTLTDVANGYVIADAVAITPEGAAPNQAIWQLNVPTQGNYDLYAKWTAHANRASDTPFNISHVNGETPLAVNQQVNGSQWNLLGNFSFDQTSTVSLSDQADGYVIADALRVVGMVSNTTQSTLHYIHTDHLGTPREITDENNTTLWSWMSDPFGKTAANDDVDGDGQTFEFNLRFAGQYYDVETGLHYNYFRDYDPSTGRYVQSDPIGLAGGLNTYGYVGGNPLYWNDPFGLAYFDSRPLEGMHGNPNRSPLADALNIELSHEQLFFEDNKGGNIGFLVMVR